MTKKLYTEPLMEVLEADCSEQLLAGSAVGGVVFDAFADDNAEGMAPELDEF